MCVSGHSYGNSYVTLDVLKKDWFLVILSPSMVLTYPGHDLKAQGQRSECTINVCTGCTHVKVESQGLKYIEPGAGLQRVLPVIRYGKSQVVGLVLTKS